MKEKRKKIKNHAYVWTLVTGVLWSPSVCQSDSTIQLPISKLSFPPADCRFLPTDVIKAASVLLCLFFSKTWKAIRFCICFGEGGRVAAAIWCCCFPSAAVLNVCRWQMARRVTSNKGINNVVLKVNSRLSALSWSIQFDHFEVKLQLKKIYVFC